jgi:Na+/proline symporter
MAVMMGFARVVTRDYFRCVLMRLSMVSLGTVDVSHKSIFEPTAVWRQNKEFIANHKFQIQNTASSVAKPPSKFLPTSTQMHTHPFSALV